MSLLNDPIQAEQNYSKIVSDYPGSNYLSRTLVQLGLISTECRTER